MINERAFRVKENGEPNSICLCTKPQLIENYDKAIADTTQRWDCHHRLETHFSDGNPRPKNAQLSQEELIALGMYYDRPAEELVFLTVAEHTGLHHKGDKREPPSEEIRKKISETKKGKPRNYYSNGSKGMHWYNNGSIATLAFDCPDGYVPGRLNH